MTVHLRPLREDEYERFYADGVAGYTRDLEVNGGLTPEHAREKGKADFARLLPEGLSTPDQFVLAVQDEERRRVGVVWWALQTNQIGVRYAFLYDITIDEAERGSGLGRAAMLALEDEVRAHGIDRIELNVFGGNEVARGLYRALGYAESAVHMGKGLAPA